MVPAWPLYEVYLLEPGNGKMESWQWRRNPSTVRDYSSEYALIDRLKVNSTSMFQYHHFNKNIGKLLEFEHRNCMTVLTILDNYDSYQTML